MREQSFHIESSLQSIPWNETIDHPHSIADPDGRVFLWEGRLYRGIFPAAAPFFRKLAEKGIISNLVKQGLFVNTELTPFTSSEYSLIFRHQLVPFASYPQEWCPLMVKDAALAIVDLAIELAHDGLILKDGHPWNVLFDACKPVYVDLGSIALENRSSVWDAYPDFCHYCLYPLILMTHGYDLMGRLLMCEDRGVRESELFRLAPQLAIQAYFRWPVNLVLSNVENQLTSVANQFLKKESTAKNTESSKQPRNQKNLLRFLKQLRRLVESIPVSTFDFKKKAQENLLDPAEKYSGVKALNGEVLNRILSELHPDSMLEINSGTGSLAKQAASLGVHVICFDPDQENVSHLYSEAKTKGLSILPLVMDFTKPTPARGFGSHWSIAATERFQCDLVLALDIFDQPMSRRLGLEKIIGGIGQFSKRWLVLDLPIDPVSSCSQMNNNSKVFSIDSCIRLLETHFRTVTKMASSVKGSMIFVCEKS